MKIIEIMIGIPGSGKSTFAKEISKQTGAIIFSSDGIREELINNNGLSEAHNKETKKVIFNELHRRLFKALNQGKDVIVDATNTERTFRNEYIDYGKKYGYYVRGRYFKITKKHALERVKHRQLNKRDINYIENPKKVVDDFYQKFKLNLPNLSDGYDELITYKIKDNKLELYKIEKPTNKK